MGSKAEFMTFPAVALGFSLAKLKKGERHLAECQGGVQGRPTGLVMLKVQELPKAPAWPSLKKPVVNSPTPNTVMIFAMSHTKKTKQNHHVSVPFKMGLYLYICIAFESILKTKTKKMMRNRETDKKPPDFLGPISLLPSPASPRVTPHPRTSGSCPVRSSSKSRAKDCRP